MNTPTKFGRWLGMATILLVAIAGLYLFTALQAEREKIASDSKQSPTKIPDPLPSPTPIPFVSADQPKGAAFVDGCPELKPRPKPRKPAHTTIPYRQPWDRIYVQFVEGSGIRLRGGRLVSLTGTDLRDLNRVLSQFKLRIERLYSRPEDQLEKELRELEIRSCTELADKNLAYVFHVSPGQDTEKLIDLLNALPILELAGPAPIGVNS